MSKIIYQLALRTFTPQGTLQAAAARLEHVAALGVDILYVCPFYVQENDTDTTYWSQRQLASQTGNPKNPYKIADYFGVDEEYGTAEDLKRFVDKAHRLGLAVMFDLVYLHCGRQAVFLAEHPDFAERNEDGSLRVPDRWPFARLNFANPDLREYLISHMLWLITEYDVDGFRCDVGDSVPLDFWQEAFPRVRAVKPELIAMNEGWAPEHIAFFDMGYSFRWHKAVKGMLTGKEPPTALRECHDAEVAAYGDGIFKMARMTENHDLASDAGQNRNERRFGTDATEAFLLLTYTYPGVPFLWNGCEFADDAENCMFSNRDYGRRSAMDWSCAHTAVGKRRLRFVKKAHRVYHTVEALQRGAFAWADAAAPEKTVVFWRQSDTERVLVAVNTAPSAATVTLPALSDGATPLLYRGAKVTDTALRLAPYGYFVARLSK